MRIGRYGALLALFAGGAVVGAQALSGPEALGGRWRHSFRNGLVSGEAYTSTDEVLIVPVDARRAFVSIHLNFFNGHECSIEGTADYRGGELVLAVSDMPGADNRPCRLRVWRQGARLRWTDDGGTCQGACGARGSLNGGELAWSGRRPVTARERARVLRELERPRAP